MIQNENNSCTGETRIEFLINEPSPSKTILSKMNLDDLEEENLIVAEKAVKNKTQVKRKKGNKKHKLNANKKRKVMNHEDLIKLKEENQETQNNKTKMDNDPSIIKNEPPIIKNDVKAKLKIKLQPRSKTANKKKNTKAAANNSHKVSINDKSKNLSHATSIESSGKNIENNENMITSIIVKAVIELPSRKQTLDVEPIDENQNESENVPTNEIVEINLEMDPELQTLYSNIEHFNDNQTENDDKMNLITVDKAASSLENKEPSENVEYINDEENIAEAINSDKCIETNVNDRGLNDTENVEYVKTANAKEIKKDKSSRNDKKVNKKVPPVVKRRSERRSKQIIRKNKAKSSSPVNLYNINDNDDIMCRICEQKLDNELKFYSREPKHGHEEELAILDSRLSLFSGDEEDVSKEDTRAYNKLTCFSVYCKNGHLCPFDSGLIEKDVEILVSGYVKPIYNDDPSTEGGVPGKDFGPIAHWWTTGFDVEEKPTVAFSTEIGDYILMEPSDEYAPYMKSVVVKILISKIVIEYLIYEPNASYEDLLTKLQTTPISNNSLTSFTEDMLLHHAPFICDQVMSFDETAKPSEPLLIVAPCMRRLIDLAGIAFERDASELMRQQNYRERRAGNYRKELMRKLAEERANNEGASDFVDRLLPADVVVALIAATARKKRRRSRCGTCEHCRRPACAECLTCRNQRNFESCLQRRCFYREIQEANDEDANDSVNFSQLKAESSIDAYKNAIETFTCLASELEWVGEPVAEESGDSYYEAVELNGETIATDEFVLVNSVHPEVAPQVVQIAYMWHDEAGIARFHANYLWRGIDTVLGEISDAKELFFIGKCCDLAMNCASKKVKVLQRLVPKNWAEQDVNESNEDDFYCQKFYDPITGRFKDLQPNNEDYRKKSKAPHKFCQNCNHVQLQNDYNTPQEVGKLEEKDEKIIYDAVKYRDEVYHAGSSVYLKPKSLYFKYPMMNNYVRHNPAVRSVDEEKYPEYYRKMKIAAADAKCDLLAPFDIGYIIEIFTDTRKLYVKVKKLYRPENTHRGEALNKQFDINMLFWSDEECIIPFNYVVGKCYVSHAKTLNISVDEWSALGPDRFYFTQLYKNKEFYDIDRKEHKYQNEMGDNPKDYPKITKLRTLDIFAGCGGLSLGLRQAGLAKSCWAIEADEAAASTYKLNSPDTEVFVENCDVILKKVIKGDGKLNDQHLPLRGEIDLICSSLPCENLRIINNISTFKNSPIATFLSYCEYYRPSFFVLEADERLIKRSVVFKLTLACLVSIGYQVTFDLMQVGCYGAPQNRTRSVILGAAPGQTLPKYPKYLHVFSKSFCQSGIVIDNKKYTRGKDWIDSAPYRAMTIRDALSDLPTIEVRKNKEIINYDNKTTTYFQKVMRMDMLEPTLFDHICKDLGPLVQARIMQIPTALGSSWHNLPNIEIQLKDGTFTKKLIYNYDDLEAGKSSQGGRRGICACSIGKRCDPRDRQEDTLIPWHLVHTAKRHAHWPQLYSRLQWDGFFAGAITNPEPLGEQGPVLHPTQPRVVSVRECARAQGFPDDFALARGIDIHDKYRQIGRAASPLLARAIGFEIARSLDSKDQ